MEDRSHTARKDLGDKAEEGVVAGINNARAVAKWTEILKGNNL
jgi:hypothetical protein